MASESLSPNEQLSFALLQPLYTGRGFSPPVSANETHIVESLLCRKSVIRNHGNITGQLVSCCALADRLFEGLAGNSRCLSEM